MGRSLASTGPGGSASPKAAERGGFRSAGEGRVRAQSGLPMAPGAAGVGAARQLPRGQSSTAVHGRPPHARPRYSAAGLVPSPHSQRSREQLLLPLWPSSTACACISMPSAHSLPVTQGSPPPPATWGLSCSLGPNRTGPGSSGHTWSLLFLVQTCAEPLLSACLCLWRLSQGQGTLLSTALALSTKHESVK